MDYELGIRDNTFKPLNVAGNFFLSDIKHEIYVYTDPITIANSNYESPTRRYGLEMESSLKFFEKRWFNITPFFNLTAQKAYFKGGQYSGKTIPLVPSFKYATGYALQPVKGLTVSTELNHLGQQFPINDQRNNLPKLKAYSIVDMKVRYHWRWATVWISLTNLFNKKYSDYSISNQVGTMEVYYPAQGRNFVSGFSLEY
jgi:outer membrane receptor protein involved in Fe transport